MLVFLSWSAIDQAESSPDMMVSAASLDFGRSYNQKTLFITNQSPDQIQWHAVTNTPWIQLSPDTSTIESSQTQPEDAPYSHSRLGPQDAAAWYVISPEGVGVDHKDQIYVLDSGSSAIQKFSAHDEFLFEITADNFPNPDDYLVFYPQHLAFDAQNNFYVSGQKVKKFDENGNFLSTIKKMVSGQETAYTAYDLAVNSQNQLYVTDIDCFCVHKFDQNGNYLLSWGSRGMGPGQFDNYSMKIGIVIDSANFVFIADNHYSRIQKFDPDGNFIQQWGFNNVNFDQLVLDSQFVEAFAIDSQDIIYIGHEDVSTLGKFDTQGNPVPFQGGNPQPYNFKGDLAVKKSGSYYIVGNDRTIAKFNASGRLLKEFKSHHKGVAGRFYWPVGMAIDKQGRIFIRDEDQRIQIFGPDLAFIDAWDLSGEEFPFDPLSGASMEIDSQGNVYLSHRNNENQQFIAKLNPQGNLIDIWYFNELPDIYDIAIDSQDQVYLLTKNDLFQPLLVRIDQGGNIVQQWVLPITTNSARMAIDSQDILYVADYLGGIFKFDLQGHLIATWNFAPSVVPPWRQSGNTNANSSIAVDSESNVYGLFSNGDIQKYDANGNLLTQWSRGGTEAGEILPTGGGSIGIGKNNNVYVEEHGSNRIQMFSQAVSPVQVTIDRSQLLGGVNSGSIDVYNLLSPEQPLIEIVVTASKKTGCFIATAAYGTPFAEDINVLRDFRDSKLMKSRAGRDFVELYYEASPPIADKIASRPWLKSLVRNLLKPIVEIGKRMM